MDVSKNKKPLCFNVSITNTGLSSFKKPSDVVVLAFLKSDHVDAPIAKLGDFKRLSKIQVGETRSVSLCVEKRIPLVNEHGEERILPGNYTVSAGVKGGVGGSGAGTTIGTIVLINSQIGNR